MILLVGRESVVDEVAGPVDVLGKVVSIEVEVGLAVSVKELEGLLVRLYTV